MDIRGDVKIISFLGVAPKQSNCSSYLYKIVFDSQTVSQHIDFIKKIFSSHFSCTTVANFGGRSLT
jgi:hypothetical protein